MLKKKYVLASVLALPLALSLTACDINAVIADGADQSTTRSAKTSEEGVAKGILPTWVPEGGTNVELVQRNSGSERIFVLDYSGDLPAQSCTPVQKTGQPTAQELARAYASDERVKRLDPEELSTTRTLDAEWWPEAAQSRTTHLCERFWVHQADGKLYAFSPDTVSQVSLIQQERAEANKGQ